MAGVRFWPIAAGDERILPALHLAITPAGLPSIEGMVPSVSKRLSRLYLQLVEAYGVGIGLWITSEKLRDGMPGG